MRRAGLVLLLAALILAGLRLFTGIVYRADEPVAALVLKHQPGPAIERTETPDRPLARDIVLDQEEPRLFYGALYLGAMRAAPVAIVVMLVAAAILLARARPRRRA